MDIFLIFFIFFYPQNETKLDKILFIGVKSVDKNFLVYEMMLYTLLSTRFFTSPLETIESGSYMMCKSE